MQVDTAEHHYETVMWVIQAAGRYTHWPTFFLGALAFAIMFTLKRIAPRVPNVLVAVTITTVISWAIGYQHNTTVGVNAIQHAKARELIGSFNAALDDVSRLGAKRTEATRRLDEAKASADAIAVLDAKHDAEVVSLQIEDLQGKAHVYREELRGFLFRGVSQNAGEMQFFPAHELPPGARDDGFIWRIQVGNGPIKPDSVRLTGGGDVVGMIPKGLPTLTLPKIELSMLLHLFPYAAIISFLGFMEAISIAKAMAAKTGQRLDPNQELIGQGLANMIGAIGKSYPVSGSFSRSAVNLQAGAVTGLSSVFTSLAVVIMLLFLTPLLYHLPQSVLAAVIMMAVIGLINVLGFRPRLEGAKAGRDHFDHLLCLHAGLCSPSGQGHHDRRGALAARVSLQSHAAQGDGLWRGTKTRPCAAPRRTGSRSASTSP